jgi:Tol biopolymer transport system component
LASELKWIGEGGSQAGLLAPLAPRPGKNWTPWAVAATFAVLTLVAGLLYFGKETKPADSIYAYLPPPENTTYFFSGDSAGFPTISPRGDQVAFVAIDERAARLLWVRSLADGSARSLPGTESAAFPFWSPDGKSLAFFAQGKIKRVALEGGSPIDIAPAESARGGSWSKDDVILFTPATQTGLFRVSASGGTPQLVTTVDKARHTTNRWPYFLPDGQHFLYFAGSHAKPHAEFDAIYLASLDGKENRLLTASTSNAVAVRDYLLFLRGTTLVAQHFDLSSATLKGEPIPVAQNVHFEDGNWHGVFDCSPDGKLVYLAAAGTQGSQLLWFGRDGRALGKLDDPGHYNELSLSPDGRRLAASVGDPGANLWVYDLERHVRTRYSFAGNTDRSPVWSPDGAQIAFSRIQPPANNIYVIASESAGTEKPLFTSGTLKWPTSWSADGKYLLFTETPIGFGVSLVPTSGDITTREFLPKKINSSEAQFSPDTHWVAYTSQESGRPDVFVTQFPGPNGKWQVSTNGGTEPRWRHDGKAIFYWGADNTFMEAQVEAQGSQFRVNSVHPLFKASMPVTHYGAPTYDVTPDGQRFIVNATSSASDQSLTIVTDWTANLKR